MRSAWREINRGRHGSVRGCRPPATGVPRRDSDSLRRCGALATQAGTVAGRPLAATVFRNSPRRKSAGKLGLLEPAAVGPSRPSGHTSLGKQGVRQQGSSHEASVVPNRIHGAGPFPGGALGRGECPGNLQRKRRANRRRRAVRVRRGTRARRAINRGPAVRQTLAARRVRAASRGQPASRAPRASRVPRGNLVPQDRQGRRGNPVASRAITRSRGASPAANHRAVSRRATTRRRGRRVVVARSPIMPSGPRRI